MSWFFGHEAWGILVPQPGIEPAPPFIEGEVLTTGPQGKSQDTGLFPWGGSHFHSSNSVTWRIDVPNFHILQYIVLIFMVCAFYGVFKKSLVALDPRRSFPVFSSGSLCPSCVDLQCSWSGFLCMVWRTGSGFMAFPRWVAKGPSSVYWKDHLSPPRGPVSCHPSPICPYPHAHATTAALLASDNLILHGVAELHTTERMNNENRSSPPFSSSGRQRCLGFSWLCVSVSLFLLTSKIHTTDA